MQALVTDSSDQEINVSLKDADIGTLYVIQHELLKNSAVDFAGVIVKHPLTDECWLRVRSSKSKPFKELQKATDAALKATAELKGAFDSKLGSK